MNKNIQGHLFALTANILWGLMAPIGKSALVEFSALSVTTFRMVGAAACFWLLSLFCKREQVDHRDMLKIFFAALFALVFNQGVYIFGLSMTSPIDASIVTTTLPIVTMIVAAIYLKEPVTNKKVLGIFVGAMGAFILIMSSQTTGAGNGSLIGDLLCPNQLLHLSDRIQGVVAKILSHHPEQMDVCLCLHVLHPVLLPRRGCHTVERNIYSRPAASGICGCGRKLPCLYLHNECAEAVAPHCGEHVQLHAAHRGLNRCHHLRIGSVQFGKGNSHSLGIPGSVHRDTKQVTQGFRERRESRIKQPFHRHSTPARTRLRDSGVINR